MHLASKVWVLVGSNVVVLGVLGGMLRDVMLGYILDRAIKTSVKQARTRLCGDVLWDRLGHCDDVEDCEEGDGLAGRTARGFTFK